MPSVPAQTAADEELLTIDELAARTGLTVRTIRFYAGHGLLPPPMRRGRLGYYSAPHRMRLDFIRELQDYGYTLAAIERVLARIPFEVAPGDLALHRAMLAPWAPERSEDFDRAGLQRRAGRELDEAALDFLLAMGTVERTGDGRYRTTPSVLAMGIELLDMPVPRSVLTQAAAVISQHATAAAGELSEVFRRGVWEPYRQGQLDRVDQDQLTAVVSRLRPIAVQSLVAAFERAADRAIRRDDPNAAD
ncbi:MAG TPA: MerR family transcriptional regulator [Jatrophihabitans sp.]|nr:MerR family transcriptional regulator [Jatrophihabitans sp.]